MASTTRVYGANGAGPTLATVDALDGASYKFGRDDLLVSTANIPIPTATGTNFSYLKYLCLDVTATSTTSITNRKVYISAALASGLSMWWYATATYVQNAGTTGTTAGQYPASSASNGATPASPTGFTYAAVTTTPTVYDNASVATSATGRNGMYVVLVFGVDNTYAGGGNATTNPGVANAAVNTTITYDES